MERDQRREALDLVLVQRAQHPPVACSRSASQTISLATIGSYIGEISEPGQHAGVDAHARARRAPGSAPIVPGAGAKFFAASSALMRHSIAWPRSDDVVLA